ncbi:MAG: phage holin family protein [Syntrophomonadaceae bacterium]|nr:phage holin family protein [Syntrophomonadaceae bacterium]
MRKFIYIAFSNFVAFSLAGMIFPSIRWDGYLTLVEAALLLTACNWLLRPLIMFIALPLNLITVGLFVLIINAWMVMLTAWLLPGWQSPGFWLALVTGILVGLCNSIAKKASSLL